MNRQNSTKRLKSELKGFQQAFISLPRNQLMNVRVEFMDRLGWSVSVFYYKKRGDTPIWDHELPVIEEIFSRFRIDFRTGNQINN